jgi:hypothetical protein
VAVPSRAGRADKLLMRHRRGTQTASKLTRCRPFMACDLPIAACSARPGTAVCLVKLFCSWRRQAKPTSRPAGVSENSGSSMTVLHHARTVELALSVLALTGCAATEQSRSLDVPKVAAASAPAYQGVRSPIAVGKFDNRSSFMRGMFSDGLARLAVQDHPDLASAADQSLQCDGSRQSGRSPPGSAIQGGRPDHQGR